MRYLWARDYGLSFGLSDHLAHIFGLVMSVTAIVLIVLSLLWVSRNVFLKVWLVLISKTKLNWYEELSQNGFFHHIAHLTPAVVIALTSEYIFDGIPDWYHAINKLNSIYFIVIFYFIVHALLASLADLYSRLSVGQKVPLKGFFQIFKLLNFIICLLLVIATILDKSPTYLLSGLGALTAVLLLVFKDTILGLVAGIQLATNRMVSLGDWIEIPALNIDGVVKEVGLNTVTIKSWDNTISYLPTYELISRPFKNWRVMEDSGGRRFKRQLLIDPNSVYEIPNDHEENSLSSINSNLTEFRALLKKYLCEHQHINQEYTQLIRILPPRHYGIPLEVYFFVEEVEWQKYEEISADIYEDILILAKRHSLNINTLCRDLSIE